MNNTLFLLYLLLSYYARIIHIHCESRHDGTASSTCFRCVTRASSCLRCFSETSVGRPDFDFDMNSDLKLLSSSSSWLSSSTSCSVITINISLPTFILSTMLTYCAQQSLLNGTMSICPSMSQSSNFATIGQADGRQLSTVTDTQQHDVQQQMWAVMFRAEDQDRLLLYVLGKLSVKATF